jgi:hypothetical protein
MIEFLLEFLVEVLGETLFAVAGMLLEEALSDEAQATPLFAAAGQFLIGLVAGGISLLLLQHRVVAHAVVPGASLLLAPLGTGMLMEILGRWTVRRGNVRAALLTFRGGFSFALGMAVVRFAYFEKAWTWF